MRITLSAGCLCVGSAFPALLFAPWAIALCAVGVAVVIANTEVTALVQFKGRLAKPNTRPHIVMRQDGSPE